MFTTKQLARVDLLWVGNHFWVLLGPVFANGYSCICWRRKDLSMFSAFLSFQLALTLGVTADRKHQVEFVPHPAFYPWYFTLTVPQQKKAFQQTTVSCRAASQKVSVHCLAKPRGKYSVLFFFTHLRPHETPKKRFLSWSAKCLFFSFKWILQISIERTIWFAFLVKLWTKSLLVSL